MRLPSLANVLSFSSYAAPQIPFAVDHPTEVIGAAAAAAAEHHSHRLISDETRRYLHDRWRDWDVPGMAVAALRIKPGHSAAHNSDDDGGIEVEFINFGTAGERVGPVTQDTLFGIASNSKAFTAAAVGRLVDQGALRWTDKMKDTIPGFGFKDDVAHAEADLLDMMSHRTGLPRHDRGYAFSELGDAVRRVSRLEPSVEFRKEWQYNNLMFITAAHLVSLKSGKNFTDYVTEQFFDKLGMESSTYHPLTDARARERLSTGYQTLDNKTNIEVPWTFPPENEHVQVAAGAGGIVSSTRDLSKWVAFLIRQRNATATEADKDAGSQRRRKDDNILSSDSIKMMASVQTAQERHSAHSESSPLSYGLGLMTNWYKGIELIRHGGSLPGAGSQIMWNSHLGIGAIALCNSVGNGNTLSDMATYRVMEDLAGLGHDDVDWQARYSKAGSSRSALSFRPNSTSPGHAAPSLSPSLFGTYEDESYGTASLCPLSSSQPHAAECENLYRLLSNGRVLSGNDPAKEGDAETVAYWWQPAPFQEALFYVEKYGYNETMRAYAVTPVSVFEPTERREETVLLWSQPGKRSAMLRFSKDEQTAQMWGVWGPGPEQMEREAERGYDLDRAEVTFEKV